MQLHQFVVQDVTKQLGVVYGAFLMRGITERSAVVQLRARGFYDLVLISPSFDQ